MSKFYGKKWFCQRQLCGNVNPESFLFCLKCNNLKDTMLDIFKKESYIYSWNCASCNHENIHTANICLRCWKANNNSSIINRFSEHDDIFNKPMVTEWDNSGGMDEMIEHDKEKFIYSWNCK